MRTEKYDITGMHCAACSSAVERVTRKLPGVTRSEVNLTTGIMNIAYDDSQTTPEDICKKVEKAGFGCVLHQEEPPPQTEEDKKNAADEAYRAKKRNLIGAAVFSAILLYVSMGQMLPTPLPLSDLFSMVTHPVNFAVIQLVLTIPVLIFGKHYLLGGFSALIHRNPNMDSLVAIGSGCSFAYSLVMTFLITDNHHHVHDLYYESAATVLTLIMLGKFLEARSVQKTKSAITKLMELKPDTALLADGREVPTASLKVGDIILVKPGAKVAADGIVVEGHGSINEAMLTGESLPVDKEPGSEVIGGSVSMDGLLQVKVSRVGADSTLSRIIQFVEDAQGRKAPIAKIADKVAGVFVPVVMCIAALAAVIWAVTGQDISFVLRIFTSVLVIACPCALGLATPTAIMVGTGLGASNGILIRSGEALETTHTVTAVVLDKTGTVTEGKPIVQTILPAAGISEHQLLTVASAAETGSGHPLAKAVVDCAAERGIIPSGAPKQLENLSGRGLRALVDETVVLAGSRRLLEESGVDISEWIAPAQELAAQGQTLLWFAQDGVIIGLITVADPIKSGSADAIAGLRTQGIRTILLTGDNRLAAEAIGRQAGVDEVIAEVLPEEKAAVVQRLQKEGAAVMMVGDGINDAPALAQADVGCAIGNGSDIAIESASVILMRNDLRDVARAIRLSRLTIRNIKQNLFWAFCYNTICIPVAAGILYPAFQILLTPMIAGAAMSLSSLCVVSNALRLRTQKL